MLVATYRNFGSFRYCEIPKVSVRIPAQIVAGYGGMKTYDAGQEKRNDEYLTRSSRKPDGLGLTDVGDSGGRAVHHSRQREHLLPITCKPQVVRETEGASSDREKVSSQSFQYRTLHRNLQ